MEPASYQGNDISLELLHKPCADDPNDDPSFLKDVLAKCETDDKWDLSIPFEAAMADRGEKRYNFKKKEWSRDVNISGTRETEHWNLDKDRN